METKEKIGIFGGAFNPITKGHIEICKYVLDQKIVDRVYLTPCYQHMYNKDMVDPVHRLKMCEIAAKVDGRICVFDYEIANKLKGSTYNFVKRLQDEEFAKHDIDFSLIIGLDNANTFDKWVDSELLEKMIRFVVVPRKGIERDEKVNWYLKTPHIYLSPDNDIPETSSTDARELLSHLWVAASLIQENPLTQIIDQNVLNYIMENKLYNT